MINLNRAKDNKWILQKNISSDDLFDAFIYGMSIQDNQINNDLLRQSLKANHTYRGRSYDGASSTMGVRLSQACFYMFGYKKDGKFISSPMTDMCRRHTISRQKASLVNLFSMQFPSPYSNTSNNFHIFIGRLIIKLLLEEKLDKRLYIDECIYFLPFIESIDKERYLELVDSILEWRNKTFFEKNALFHAIPEYDEIFANCAHEMNYYFLRIFQQFGVIDIIGDQGHNDGQLFVFKHGSNSTRNDAYAPHQPYSGYIQLNSAIEADARRLIAHFSPFGKPIALEDSISKDEWIRDLYEFEPLKYINLVNSKQVTSGSVLGKDDEKTFAEVIQAMVYHSKYGSRDGKSFEHALKPLFELFRENRSADIISGSGDTDLLCVMDNMDDNLYKVNVDAKTSRTSIQQINSRRIIKHLEIHGAKYCIIVSPRFCRGVRDDILGTNIVTIKAESLANYCLKECSNSNDNQADYTTLDTIITKNLGQDISDSLDRITEERYAHPLQEDPLAS